MANATPGMGANSSTPDAARGNGRHPRRPGSRSLALEDVLATPEERNGSARFQPVDEGVGDDDLRHPRTTHDDVKHVGVLGHVVEDGGVDAGLDRARRIRSRAELEDRLVELPPADDSPPIRAAGYFGNQPMSRFTTTMVTVYAAAGTSGEAAPMRRKTFPTPTRPSLAHTRT